MAEDHRTARSDLDDDELVERLAEAQGGAVQPALPARHRPARQHRPARRRSRKEIARINTELREREIDAAEALAANEETA